MPVKMSTVDMALDGLDDTYFFDRDDEEEMFYEDSLNKDLWKKFELHTPPQSPPHNPFPPDNEKTKDKKVHKVFSALACWDECVLTLNSNLIQDCMWSGPCLAAAGLISPAHKNDSLKSSKSPASSCSNNMDISASSSVSSANNVDINSSECVSPAAVFPYPINEPTKKTPITSCSFNLGSVAETPSPSESEDEEIDVVTVVAEKIARKRHHGHTIVQPSSPDSSAAAASFKSHVAAIHNYSNTHSVPSSFSAPQSPQASSGSQRESASLCHKRSRPLSMPASPQPAKKSRSLLQPTDLKRVVQKLKLGHQSSSSSSSSSYRYQTSSSRNSSDSEECDTNKRAQHNVLERKRRNDLKYSFLKLRDNVPELAKQERTPKVTILKQSADYVRRITHRNKTLESDLQKAKVRYENMKRKLMALRRECL